MPDPDLKLISKAIDKGVWLLENGVSDFQKWSRTMVYAFGDQIRPELERIWGCAQEQLATAKSARANHDSEQPRPAVAETASTPQDRRLRTLAVAGVLALMACLIFAAAWTWGREWQARKTRTKPLTVAPKDLLPTNPAPARLAATFGPRELEASAAKGDADAQYDLGERYSKGNGVPLDQEKAVAWYRRAADQGLAKAQAGLGRCYAKGEGVAKDYSQAVAWFRKAAEQGDAKGQNGLGLSFARGQGVAQDYTEAVKWFRKAAEQEYAAGQDNLGVSFAQGHGVPQDYAEAVTWYRKAAEQGYTNAQCNLGGCYALGHGVSKDYAEAVKWVRKAAEQGDARGQNLLGLCYAKGQSVAQDYTEAVRWFRKAAEQGYAKGQVSLAVSYATGKGVPQDQTEAAHWYRKAADQGDAKAQLSLGVSYAEGNGVNKDLDEADKWFSQAEGKANESAKKDLAGGTGKREQKESTEELASGGDPDAQFNMGIRYRYGVGVRQDYVEAYKWFLLAASQLQVEAVRYCDLIKLSLTPQMALEGQRRAGAFAPKRPLRKNDPTKITTIGGQTYNSVRVLRVEQDGLAVEYTPQSGGVGMAKIRFASLPSDLQQQYQADAEEAAVKARRQAERVLALKAYEAERLRRMPGFTAAESGDAQAQFNIGCRYWWGGYGLEVDKRKALDWWLKAAEQGHAKAQFNYALTYAKGNDVGMDLGLAAKWYRRAAAQGFAAAQFNLGNMCATGNGAPKDYVEAYKWFSLAAAQGDADFARHRDELARFLRPAQRLEAEQRASAFVAKEERGASPSEGRRPRPKTDEVVAYSGTAFFITDDGYLVTCAHVVEGSTSVHIKTASGEISARLIKEDPLVDVALLKVSGEFHAMPVCSESSGLKLGAPVFTIGFPNTGLQGMEPKLTSGEISSLAGMHDDPRYFQISVPVQPGNSGGPLVDERGNVVGVVTARLNDRTTYEASGALPQNVNYAVKSELVYKFLSGVPELSGKLKAPRTASDREAASRAAERAAVLVVAE